MKIPATRSVAASLTLCLIVGVLTPSGVAATTEFEDSMVSFGTSVNDVSTVGLAVDSATGAFSTSGGATVSLDPQSGIALLAKDGVALGPIIDTVTGSAATVNPLTKHLVDLNQPGAIRNGPAFNCDCHWTWGWVSGTLYLNKLGTKLFGIGGAFVSQMLSAIPSPFAWLIRTYVASLITVAAVGAATGRCFKLKTYGSGLLYTGGFCT